MNQGVRLVRFDGDESQVVAQAPSAQVQLRHVRNVTNSIVQDALNVWADLWGELEDNVTCGVTITLEGEKGFKPSCGWPEFLEKMWVLRQNLDFLVRFSRPPDDEKFGVPPSGDPGPRKRGTPNGDEIQ